MTREIVVISGKGGTGKTSLAASFAMLAEIPVIADCDVDAADLHLVLRPQVQERYEFKSGHEAVIRQADCVGCGVCLDLCRFDAVRADERTAGGGMYFVDPVSCEGCGVCVRFCPVEAIDFPERLCGEWMVSKTRFGPMVHARLGVAAENSGKLVSTVRREARRIAEEDGRSLVIVDGPPGIGCPVIASVTGASMVLVVTEPSVSGEHDLERVLALTRHFGIPATVCVNKWDLHAGMTERIEDQARQAGARVVGRIRYDPVVTTAQMQERAVVEIDAPAAEDIRNIWWQLGLREREMECRDKEVKHMRIAIPLAGGKLSMHFGHCESFALVDVDPTAKKILKREDMGAPPHQPGLLPPWLAKRGAQMIIAGGMGQRAQGLFAEQGIRVVLGASAETPERLVGDYIAGTLEVGENLCDH
jgi:MinD superfamily P-loop ATPase/predicted Fe-Mo cluster-binding NifX family protein